MNRLGSILVALVLVAGCVTWGVGVAYRSYDSDEVQRAHSIWMASQDLRPYYDFLECHPPYFALLAPLARVPFDPGTFLVTLRLVAVAGNLLFLTGLLTVAMSNGGAGRFVALMGTAFVAFHPAVLEFLVEFRIDGWGYAMAIWSVVRLRRSRGTWRHLEFGATTGIATLLLCPKLTLLSPLIVLIEQLKLRSSVRDSFRAGVTYVAGLVAAGAIFWGYLASNGIGVARTFDYLVRYHMLTNTHSGFGHGLFRTVAAAPLLSVPILAGAAAWLIHAVRTRSLPDAYLCALALWLAAQMVFVSFPYSQYSAPWLLFASGFLPFLARAVHRVPQRVAAGVFVLLCSASLWTATAAARSWAAWPMTRPHEAVLRFMSEVSEPGDHVVATPPFHPIDRRDTFYVWFNTLDPAAYGTERALEAIPELRGLVTDQRYRDELEANPPVFVVLQRFDYYPPRQRAVLVEFMQERGYILSTPAGMRFAVRPDRYDRFVQTRLTY